MGEPAREAKVYKNHREKKAPLWQADAAWVSGRHLDRSRRTDGMGWGALQSQGHRQAV